MTECRQFENRGRSWISRNLDSVLSARHHKSLSRVPPFTPFAFSRLLAKGKSLSLPFNIRSAVYHFPILSWGDGQALWPKDIQMSDLSITFYALEAWKGFLHVQRRCPLYLCSMHASMYIDNLIYWFALVSTLFSPSSCTDATNKMIPTSLLHHFLKLALRLRHILVLKRILLDFPWQPYTEYPNIRL